MVVCCEGPQYFVYAVQHVHGSISSTGTVHTWYVPSMYQSRYCMYRYTCNMTNYWGFILVCLIKVPGASMYNTCTYAEWVNMWYR